MAADKQVLESLAFLYIALGHSTDGNLDAEEMRSLAAKLREWAPSTDLAELGGLLKDSVATYKGAANKVGRARELTTELRAKLDDSQRSKVIADLEAIAAADGHVSDEEKAFVEQTRAALEG